MNEMLDQDSKPKNPIWVYAVVAIGSLLFSAIAIGAMLGLGWLFYDGHIGIRKWSKNFQWANKAIGVTIWVFVVTGLLITGVSKIKELWNRVKILKQ